MNEVDYRAIRRRVTLRWLNRLLFAINALMFATIMVRLPYGGVYIDSTTVVVWFLVLIAHFLWAFNIVGGFIESQTDREAERLRARGYTVIAPERARTLTSHEKPKRAARLANDGEIEYDDEFVEPDDAHTVRQHRAQD